MNSFKCLALGAVAGICFMVTAPKIEAQVSVGVNIGAAPACPYGATLLLVPVLPTATTARNGLRVMSSSAPARGFMALTTSEAT